MWVFNPFWWEQRLWMTCVFSVNWCLSYACGLTVNTDEWIYFVFYRFTEIDSLWFVVLVVAFLYLVFLVALIKICFNKLECIPHASVYVSQHLSHDWLDCTTLKYWKQCVFLRASCYNKFVVKKNFVFQFFFPQLTLNFDPYTNVWITFTIFPDAPIFPHNNPQPFATYWTVSCVKIYE